MATLPTVPTFGANTSPSIATLNQMSNAVSFVTQMPIVISLKRNATQSVSASTNTAVQWNVSEVDSDSMHSTVTNPSRLTAATQGYYKLKATVAFSGASTAAYRSCWFQQTTGSNNPAGSGNTMLFSGSNSYSGTTSSDYEAFTISAVTPCLYIGDYVEVYCFSAVAATLQYNFRGSSNLDSAGNADGSCCLYGYYMFEGP